MALNWNLNWFTSASRLRRYRNGMVCLYRGPGGLRHCGMTVHHNGDHALHSYIAQDHPERDTSVTGHPASSTVRG